MCGGPYPNASSTRLHNLIGEDTHPNAHTHATHAYNTLVDSIGWSFEHADVTAMFCNFEQTQKKHTKQQQLNVKGLLNTLRCYNVSSVPGARDARVCLRFGAVMILLTSVEGQNSKLFVLNRFCKCFGMWHASSSQHPRQ